MKTWIITFPLLLNFNLANAHDGDQKPLPLPKFERIVIDDDFPGGYQVEVADVNGDGRPDIVALGAGTCAWFENPSWRKRIITGPDTTPGIISSATIDLDGDGKAEVAIAYDFAMTEPDRGKLGLAIPGESFEDPWTFRPITNVPSIHRVRWADILGDGRPELIAAPIFGQDAEPPEFRVPARISVFTTGADPIRDDWTSMKLGEKLPIIHAIEVRSELGAETIYGIPESEGFEPNPRRAVVLTADSLNGVTAIGLGGSRRLLINDLGDESSPLASSEIHIGSFDRGKNARFIATIEPWHGSQVVVRSATIADDLVGLRFGERTVLDDSLDQGHALWVADTNGDGYDEIFAGHRGNDPRVSVYHYDGKEWARSVIDRAITAQDLRGGDLNGDGIPDIVAIGGASRNIVWYRPLHDAYSAPAPDENR